MESGPLSLEELIETASAANFTSIQDAAQKVAPRPLKDWRGVWTGMRDNPHGFVTADYYRDGNRVRVHRAMDTEDHWYILGTEETQIPDEKFAAFHGYRCILPDVRLFVERQPETWMAIGYEMATKLTVMKQPVDDSAAGKAHCQNWVDSFRVNPKLAPCDVWVDSFRVNSALGLTEMLKWEVY